MSEQIFWEPVLTDSSHINEILQEYGIIHEGEVNLHGIEFCKVETQQECLSGTFCIPKLWDIIAGRDQIAFFITQDHLIFVDDSDYSKKIIEKINKQKNHHYETTEKFFFYYMEEMLSKDLEFLTQADKDLMGLEEKLQQGHTEKLHEHIMKIRRELLILRGYYEEIMDVGDALEENENDYFEKRHLRYFGTISDRAQRLMNKASHLLEYAGQIQDAYQAQIDAKQNSNMQFLTLISTIFFPLTLITGWYGMNFRNMPELTNGYPGVIALSVVVIIACIIIFKIKKIL